METQEKRFCPKCESENVNIDITATAVIGKPQMWRCNDCGYESYIFPEKEINNEEDGEEDE